MKILNQNYVMSKSDKLKGKESRGKGLHVINNNFSKENIQLVNIYVKKKFSVSLGIREGHIKNHNKVAFNPR